MKKITLYLITALVLSAALDSCQKEELADGVFSATMERFTNKDNSKMVLDDSHYSWQQGVDKIKVARQSISNDNPSFFTGTYLATSVNQTSGAATFTYVDATSEDEDNVTNSGYTGNYYAYFPDNIYDSRSTNENRIDLPSIQHTDGQGRLLNAPMYAEASADNRNLHFKNLCGIVRLNLTKSNTNISKIVINTPGNRINGQFDISLNNNRYALEPYSTVADPQHTVTLVCATAQDITDGHNFDIALPAGAYSNLVIDIYDNANNKCTKRLNSTHTLTIVTGQYTVIELNGNSEHHELDFEVTITGDLPGLFSVSATKQVKFSKGNLQYIPHSNSTTLEHATTDGNNRNGKYQFAENQWIRKYTANRNNINDYQNPLYTDWLDLFAWGHSGFLANNPYTASNIASTLNGTNPIAGTAYDWGVYNAISNGGDEPGLWRTLTKDEWDYLLTGRPNASTKWARANIHGTNGYILQPDEWIGDTPNATISWGSSVTDWTTNTITDNDWTTMENAGAVFLPVTGFVYESSTSDGVKVNGTGNGYYWTATASTTTNTKAYDRKFTSSNMEEEERDKRYCCAVRLVHDAYTYNN